MDTKPMENKSVMLAEMWNLLMPDNVGALDQDKQTEVWKNTATTMFNLLVGMLWGTDLTLKKIEELKKLVEEKNNGK